MGRVTLLLSGDHPLNSPRALRLCVRYFVRPVSLRGGGPGREEDTESVR